MLFPRKFWKDADAVFPRDIMNRTQIDVNYTIGQRLNFSQPISPLFTPPLVSLHQIRSITRTHKCCTYEDQTFKKLGSQPDMKHEDT